MHSIANMGELLAKVLTNFWSHGAILFCTFAFTVAPPIYADEIHDGIASMPDELDIPMDSNVADEVAPKEGTFVGNLPAKKKGEDFLFKNRKEKDYPLEFLIPFMKVSQVFRKRVPTKADAPEQSAMAPAPKVRAALNFSTNFLSAEPDPVRVAIEPMFNEPGEPIQGRTLPVKPSRHLINSLKVTQ